MEEENKAAPIVRRSPRRMSAAQWFILTTYVNGHYAASNMTDAAFAAKAQEELKFEVSDSSVAKARETLNLQPNHHAKRESRKDLEERVDVLESLVEDLQVQLKTIQLHLKTRR